MSTALGVGDKRDPFKHSAANRISDAERIIKAWCGGFEKLGRVYLEILTWHDLHEMQKRVMEVR